MGFKLAELLKERPYLPQLRCTTGKVAYASKREARAALTRDNRRTQTNMQVFWCGLCGQYHLGHPRGRVL